MLPFIRDEKAQKGKEWLCPNFGHEDVSGPKGLQHRFPHELCGKTCDCSWPPKGRGRRGEHWFLVTFCLVSGCLFAYSLVRQQWGPLLGRHRTWPGHRHSLAIFHHRHGYRRDSRNGNQFACCNRRENRRSLAIFDRKEIAHLGA